MTDDQKEAFNHIAYSYRSWPMTDPEGVLARYNELLAHVEQLIEDAVYEANEQRDYWDKEHGES